MTLWIDPRISRATEGIDEDTGLPRRASACRLHHFLDGVELHEYPEFFSGVRREFPRIDKYLVPARELRRKMREEALFDTCILPNGIDQSENLPPADDLQNQSQQSIWQGRWGNGYVPDSVTAFEKANDQTVGAHAFLGIADTLHTLPQVRIHGIRS